VFTKKIGPTGPQGKAKRCGSKDDVVKLTSYRDEIGHEIDGHGEISDQSDQDKLAPPRNSVIAEQSPQEHDAVRNETDERASCGTATDSEEDCYEEQVASQSDGRCDEQPLRHRHARDIDRPKPNDNPHGGIATPTDSRTVSDEPGLAGSVTAIDSVDHLNKARSLPKEAPLSRRGQPFGCRWRE
jgi:hypothetical protein